MEIFDLMSKSYDTDSRKVRAKTIADELRHHIADGADKSAIEFGCGTGLVGFELADVFSSLLFMDSSVGMITQVKNKLKEMTCPSLSAICCDITTAVPDNLHVDYIFSSLVLHHIVDTKTVLSSLYSLLNKEGHLFIVDIEKEDGSFHAKYPDFTGHNGFDQQELKQQAEEVGFKEVKIQTFFHEIKMVNGEEKPYSLFIMDAKR